MPTSGTNRLGSTIDVYQLLSVLGAGSTSVVYLGQRLDDARALVAVKVLEYPTAGPSADHATFRMRFVREARAANKLRNEFILPVLSYGDTDELSYMVMPVIVGGTLATRLTLEQHPLPLDEIAQYLRQLAIALDYAHGQAVVHRDVKPSNILLDEHRHVYLTDFGIARIYDNGDNALTREGPLTLTRTGQVLGTPYYMAPEQIKGEPVGPAADVYALGVVIYQLVTGQVPFQGDTPLAVALQHLQETPGSPCLLRSELPQPIELVMLKALAKDPGERYPSAGAFADAFEQGLRSLASPDSSGAATRAWIFSTGYNLAPVTTSATAAPASSASSAAPAAAESLVGSTVGGYRVARLLASGEGGAVYDVRRGAGDGPAARLHVYVVPPGLHAEEAAALGRIRAQVAALAELRHPGILPLLGHGDVGGRPYLVTEAPDGPTLAELLAQRGPLDPATGARYLGAVASAVQGAHDRGILHLNLTADCVYVGAGNGQALVDFAESRPAAAAPEGTGRRPPVYAAGDGCAPEQFAGGPVGAYTDVYALGALLYQMLAGHPVFVGKTRDDVAQQHLHSPVPSLRQVRPDLPLGIDHLMATALAKAPQSRFARPRDLTAAFHRLTDPASAEPAFVTARARTEPGMSAAQAFVAPDEHATVGSVAPQRTETAIAREDALPTRVESAYTPTPPDRMTPNLAYAPPLLQRGGGAPPAPPAAPRTRGFFNRRRGVELAGLVALVALVVGTLVLFGLYKPHQSTNHPPAARTTVAPPAVTADVHFFDSGGTNGSADGLGIATTNLAAPPAGSTYYAWLLNDATERVVPLGPLTAGQHGFSVRYTAGGDLASGTNLMGVGNRVEISLEQAPVPAPTRLVLMGVFPTGAFTHVKHLMVAFDTTPQHRGLLVGLLQQTQVLDAQAQVLLSFMQRQYYVSVLCPAQNIVNVIEGAHGAHYKPLGPDCATRNITQADDGYGILGADGYLAGVADHASLAANSSDAPSDMHLHAGHVQICMTNVSGWLTTLDQDALAVLNGNRDLSKAQEIAMLGDLALHGHDLDGDESIDPVPNEGGVVTAYDHGLLMGSLTLVAPKS